MGNLVPRVAGKVLAFSYVAMGLAAVAAMALAAVAAMALAAAGSGEPALTCRSNWGVKVWLALLGYDTNAWQCQA